MCYIKEFNGALGPFAPYLTMPVCSFLFDYNLPISTSAEETYEETNKVFDKIEWKERRCYLRKQHF